MNILSNSIISKITEDFKNNYMNHPTEPVWTSPGKGKFVQVMRRGTSEDNYWYYTQRKGQNSVAFLMYDKTKKNPYLCLKQYNGSHNTFTTGAFTGSLDKEDTDIAQIVVEEALEEAGYKVTKDNVIYLTSDIMGSTTDETVHMFIINIEGIQATKMEPENIWEANTDRLWLSAFDIAKGNEIKAKSIVLAHSLSINKKDNQDGK